MPECSAPSGAASITGIYCGLPEGHDGDHEAMIPFRWTDEEREDA